MIAKLKTQVTDIILAEGDLLKAIANAVLTLIVQIAVNISKNEALARVITCEMNTETYKMKDEVNYVSEE